MSDADYARNLVKTLKDRGYSDKAIKEIMRWYPAMVSDQAKPDSPN